jgi:hypothetical protein
VVASAGWQPSETSKAAVTVPRWPYAAGGGAARLLWQLAHSCQCKPLVRQLVLTDLWWSSGP